MLYLEVPFSTKIETFENSTELESSGGEDACHDGSSEMSESDKGQAIFEQVGPARLLLFVSIKQKKPHH